VQAATSSQGNNAAKPNPVQGVFVAHKDAHGKLRAKFVPVTTGITGDTDIEVLSGLSDGEEIVTGPYLTLRNMKDGMLLKRDTVKPVVANPDGGS
jgi:HlyD family secretion protein